MSAPQLPYRKLPGRSLTWRGQGRLWLGEDHLLEATSFFVLEQYQRFFFREAKALVIQRSKMRLAWNWVHGGFGLGSALVASSTWWIGLSNSSKDWHVALYVPAVLFGLFAAFFLILLLINLLLGPSCQCYLLTSRGWYALAAPSRLGPAERMQAQLVPLIEAAQSSLPEPESGAS